MWEPMKRSVLDGMSSVPRKNTTSVKTPSLLVLSASLLTSIPSHNTLYQALWKPFSLKTYPLTHSLHTFSTSSF